MIFIKLTEKWDGKARKTRVNCEQIIEFRAMAPEPLTTIITTASVGDSDDMTNVIECEETPEEILRLITKAAKGA